MFELALNTLNNGTVTIIIVILFLLSITKGTVQYARFYYLFRDIKFYMKIISLYGIYLSYNFIVYELYYLILETLNLQYIDDTFWSLILKIILFALVFFIYLGICKCIYILIFKNIMVECHKLLFKLPYMFRFIIFGIIKLPRAILNVLVIVFTFNTLSMFLNEDSDINKMINSSSLYNILSTKVIIPFKYDLNEIMLNIFNPIFDTFKTIGTKNIQYLYNGVTIDEATMSNDEIKKYALKSTADIDGSYSRARKLYYDVVNMLEYDNEKLEDILSEDFSNLSGAISAFETKKGICFDYASLYSVFAESINLPTRIVVGKGFDGNEWINHAWNEVYIEESNEWIEIDTTFGETGNYFDIENFEQDHKKERVIWEFSV